MQINGMGHAWVHHDDDECSVTEWVMPEYIMMMMNAMQQNGSCMGTS